MNILVWLGNRNMHPAIYPNMKSLAEAFALMGHQVITCDTANEGEILAAISLLRDEKIIDLSIGANAMGMKFILDAGETWEIYKDLDTLQISILLDEPFNPACNGYQHIAKRHLLTYLERTDKDFFSRMQIAEGKYKLFMPLGGTGSGRSLEELWEHKRNSPYDVVFSAGKFSLCRDWPDWTEYGASPAMTGILDDVLSLLQQEPVSITEAAHKVLTSRNMEENVYFCVVASFFPLVLAYIKDWRRRRVLEELLAAGIAVDIFGDGWEKGDFSGKAKLHGRVPYEEMVEVTAQAKIVVNDEACFNNGAHDRVFTAMLNGAVVVSEYSTYLAEEFADGQDLFLFDWRHIREQLQVIPKLLRDDGLREKIAAGAYAKAAQRHTWQQRAKRLLEAAEMLEFKRKLEAGKS